MTMCFLVAQRSLDPDTKHGAVAVDKNHSVLSIGYNSPPRGCKDQDIPLTRPEKYPYFLHSEENLIVNAARNGIRLDGAKLYITGHPCVVCLRQIINAGFSEVVYGPKGSVMNLNEPIAQKMLENRLIIFRQHIPNFKELTIPIG